MSSEKFENVARSWHKILINNLIGGIAWGLGATVGLAIVLTLLGFMVSTFDLDTVPIVGSYVTAVVEYINEHAGRP